MQSIHTRPAPLVYPLKADEDFVVKLKQLSGPLSAWRNSASFDVLEVMAYHFYPTDERLDEEGSPG